MSVTAAQLCEQEEEATREDSLALFNSYPERAIEVGDLCIDRGEIRYMASCWRVHLPIGVRIFCPLAKHAVKIVEAWEEGGQRAVEQICHRTPGPQEESPLFEWEWFNGVMPAVL